MQTLNNVSEYLTLKKANEKLVEENARLRNQLPESYLITDKGNPLLPRLDVPLYWRQGDKQFGQSPEKLPDAEQRKPAWNYKDMGVITSDGIVGTVVDVTPQFSRVMSVLHVNNKINARILKNNHLGTVEWTGKLLQEWNPG